MAETNRISNNQQNNALHNHINDLTYRQGQLFSKMAANKKQLRISEDPIAAVELIGLKRQRDGIEQQEHTLELAGTRVTQTADAMEDTIKIVERINELAIAAQDGSKKQADNHGIAEEINNLLQSLVQRANSNYSGGYLFGGSVTEKPPFQIIRDTSNTNYITRVYYQGDNYTTCLNTSDESTKPVNIVGANLGDPQTKGCFIDANQGIDAFQTIINLRDGLLSSATIGFSIDNNMLQQLNNIHSNLVEAHARIAEYQEAFEIDQDRLLTRKSALDQSIQQNSQANQAELMMEINQFRNVYEATLAMGGRIEQAGLLRWM